MRKWSVAEPIWTWPGDDDLKVRAGQCYTLAMQAVFANQHFGDRLFLVHGLLHPERSRDAEKLAQRPEGMPPSNPHAWVEVEANDGVMCFDLVLRLLDVREKFYDLFGCEITRRYRTDIAISIAGRRGHYGPWDKVSVALWQQRQRHALEHPEWSTPQVVTRYVHDETVLPGRP